MLVYDWLSKYIWKWVGLVKRRIYNLHLVFLEYETCNQCETISKSISWPHAFCPKTVGSHRSILFILRSKILFLNQIDHVHSPPPLLPPKVHANLQINNFANSLSIQIKINTYLTIQYHHKPILFGYICNYLYHILSSMVGCSITKPLMSKIYIWALKIMRKVNRPKFWIRQPSHTNCMFHILEEVG